MDKIVLITLYLFLSLLTPLNSVVANDDVIVDPKTNTTVQLYRYEMPLKEHSPTDNVKNIGVMYGLAWFFYPILQPKVFSGEASWEQYKKNFGEIVFDKDEPVWNYFVHPLVGSQLFLFYRADGYTRMESLGMTFITSALFEFTVEIFTEPASIQDLYQTPVLGSVIGLGLENLSLYALNSGTTFGKVFGHLINPSTLLPIYEGRTLIIPKLEPEDKGAMLKFEVRF